MSDRRRIASLVGCCVLAAATPFIAGISTAALGLIPLAYAIWLLAQSGWALATRLLLSAVVLVATGGLVIAFLILATLATGE